jgi:Protein of unknown function (DUF3325)
MVDASSLLTAFALTYVGFALLAMRQRPHWLAAAALPRSARLEPALRRRLARMGGLLVLGGVGLCLIGQGPSFGGLLSIFNLAASGLAVTFTLTWRPRWLRCLTGASSSTQA